MSRLVQIYAGLLVGVFGLIVVHAPLSVGLGTVWPEVAFVIKAWKELLLALAIVLALVIATRKGLWPRLLKDWLVRISLGYAALHVLLLAWMPQGWQAAVAGLMIDLRYVAFFLLVYLLVLVWPQVRSVFVRVGAASAAVVIGFGVLQLFLPPDILKYIGYDKQTTIAPYLTVDQNEDYIRINSTLRGPNPLGAYAAIVLGLLVSALVRKRTEWQQPRWLVSAGVGIVLTGVVLWVSYSRSAVVGAIIAVAAVVGVALWRQLPLKLWAIGLLTGVALLAGGLYAIRDTSFYAHVISHENPAEGNAVNSNEGHAESLYMGLQRMAAQPLGGGVGSTGSASLYTDEPIIIENQYLFVAHEAGWLGLAGFLALFVGIMWRLWTRRADWLALSVWASGLGLAAIGLLQPVWVDDTVSIVWWGFAAVACATAGVGHRIRRVLK